MTHQFSSQHYRQLRQLTQAYNRPAAARPGPRSSFWQTLLKLATGSTEPLVRQDTSAKEISYTVYDPTTQQQITGLSETEARIWLEQRYHR